MHSLRRACNGTASKKDKLSEKVVSSAVCHLPEQSTSYGETNGIIARW